MCNSYILARVELFDNRMYTNTLNTYRYELNNAILNVCLVMSAFLASGQIITILYCFSVITEVGN